MTDNCLKIVYYHFNVAPGNWMCLLTFLYADIHLHIRASQWGWCLQQCRVMSPAKKALNLVGNVGVDLSFPCCWMVTWPNHCNEAVEGISCLHLEHGSLLLAYPCLWSSSSIKHILIPCLLHSHSLLPSLGFAAVLFSLPLQMQWIFLDTHVRGTRPLHT